MRRSLFVALVVLVGACMPRKTSEVAIEPASSVAECRQEKFALVNYFVDGKAASCKSVMALSPDRIVSVEVLKGPAAVSHGASAGVSVILIQTKKR